MEKVGSYTAYYTLGGFERAEKEKWLCRMQKKCTQEVLPGFMTAWTNEYDVLQKAISELPQEYKHLHIIFEYGLPRYPLSPGRSPTDIAVFADAIILSYDTAIVLEFKQLDEPFIGHVRQARKYRRRIQDFHDESSGMTKRSILVLTKGENISHKYHKVHCCSAELLSQTIMDALGEHPRRHSDVKAWCGSDFSCKSVHNSIPVPNANLQK